MGVMNLAPTVMLLLLLTACIGCDGDGPLKPGEFEDPAFAKCVKDKIDYEANLGLLDKNDPDLYNKIESLACAGFGVKSIKGIENLPNIDWFGAEDNEIESLEPLRTLTKLEFLKLSNNKIKELEPLSGLNVLGALHVDRNYIEDISSLYGNTSLTMLSIWGNCISNLFQFDELKKNNSNLVITGTTADDQDPTKCQ